MASFLSSAATAVLVLISLLLPVSSVAEDKSCNIQCLVADPVCGADGVTYGCGRAEAECNGVEVVTEGPCDGEGRGLQQQAKGSCNIQCLVYDPVCGADGVTYGCGIDEAECHHVEVVNNGPCDR